MVTETRWKMRLPEIILGIALALGIVLAAPAPVSAEGGVRAVNAVRQ